MKLQEIVVFNSLYGLSVVYTQSYYNNIEGVCSIFTEAI